ncbi:MAG TPA: hypothetical protein ENH85_05715, partial [Candidatus Scalindua sp.]|nr:hypothetical protein [Candidatus Scalindua sp.]
MKKKALLWSILGAGLISLVLAQSSNAGFIQGTRVRTDNPSPFHITTSPDGKLLVVTNQSGHSVTLINAQTKKIIGEIPVEVPYII